MSPAAGATRFVRNGSCARAGSKAGPVNLVVDFHVAAQEAGRVRQALSLLPQCHVKACTPHPCERKVALLIEFAAEQQDALTELLQACVANGRLGRARPQGPAQLH